MVIQKQAWERLKRFIIKLEVNHIYHLNGEISIDVPEEVLKTHKPNLYDTWDLYINNGTVDNSLRQLDNYIHEFEEEVNTNLALELHKSLINSYFNDVINTLRNIFNRLKHDETTGSWDYDGLNINKDFQDYDLFKHFRNPQHTFLPSFNEKLVGLELFLISKEEYKKCRQRVTESLLGNTKIEWKKQVNQLVDFYLKQIEKGLIETDRKNLKAFLINNFNWNGTSLSESTIDTLLDQNKANEKLPKPHKAIDPKDFLKE
jgi:hypothetical protein